MKIQLTPKNEDIVRLHLFNFWKTHYAKKRKRQLLELKNLKLNDPTNAKIEELSKSRFLKAEAPVDLSNACKLVSQVCLQVFPLNGFVFSNSRHSFVLTDFGIYDMNRECQDVKNMKTNGRNPYEFDVTHFNRESTREGLATWNTRITEIVEELQQLDLSWCKRIAKSVPNWALLTSGDYDGKGKGK